MRILVVDDHLPTLELMCLAMTAFGHVVTSATSVVEAVELATAETPDVILSDLTFSSDSAGSSDGYALARAVRSRCGSDHVGLLAITGVVSPAGRQAALDSGFDEVLMKPFDLVSLVERIEAMGSDSAISDG